MAEVLALVVVVAVAFLCGLAGAVVLSGRRVLVVVVRLSGLPVVDEPGRAVGGDAAGVELTAALLTAVVAWVQFSLIVALGGGARVVAAGADEAVVVDGPTTGEDGPVLAAAPVGSAAGLSVGAFGPVVALGGTPLTAPWTLCASITGYFLSMSSGRSSRSSGQDMIRRVVLGLSVGNNDQNATSGSLSMNLSAGHGVSEMDRR